VVLYQNGLKDFDVSANFDEEVKETEFSNLVKGSSKYVDFKEGEVYKGTVASVNDEFVTVDIGYKQEGLVYTKEFRISMDHLKLKWVIQ
jgi:small subunit ribosomal protein S1